MSQELDIAQHPLVWVRIIVNFYFTCLDADVLVSRIVGFRDDTITNRIIAYNNAIITTLTMVMVVLAISSWTW